MITWEIRPLRLNDMDDQVSWEDLVGQPLHQTGVWFGDWPDLSGGSHSPWELRYDGAMTQLPLGCNFRQLTIKFNAKHMTAPATNG